MFITSVLILNCVFFGLLAIPVKSESAGLRLAVSAFFLLMCLSNGIILSKVEHVRVPAQGSVEICSGSCPSRGK